MQSTADRRLAAALLAAVFVIATCGLVYELVAGALASYLLGDSVTQFSTVIGVYLFAMGVGSYLSRYVERQLLSTFIRVEISIGVVGGTSAAALFLLFEYVASFRVLLYAEVLLVGTLVGLEIPLLMRILKSHFTFSDLVSQVFTFDYIGALLASLLFPLVLVPHLGLVETALLFGLINVAVGLATLGIFWGEVPQRRGLMTFGVGSLLALSVALGMSDALVDWAERQTYPDEIVYTQQSAYQRMVLTRSANDLRLYLNGNLQFSSRDEYRYHEALVHPGLAGLAAKRVLVLGGGDGLAVREVLRYAGVTHIVLVDLDSAMTGLFQRHPDLVRLNGGALNHPRVCVINADAYVWLQQHSATEKFDFIICDFPDPSSYSLGKLYSTTFYRQLARALAPGGRVVVQSTSPYVARQAFWCVVQTLETLGWHTAPYHTHVPSFGEWGYVLAGPDTFAAPKVLPMNLRFLTVGELPAMFHFAPDMARMEAEPNRLNNQALVRYFEREWDAYSH